MDNEELNKKAKELAELYGIKQKSKYSFLHIVVWRLLIICMFPLCLIADMVALIPSLIIMKWGEDDCLYPYLQNLIENW